MSKFRSELEIEYRERAYALAEKLGVTIEMNAPTYLWHLPILEKLMEDLKSQSSGKNNDPRRN